MGMLDWLARSGGVKMMQSGSDVLIGRHTEVDVFGLPLEWRRGADEFLKKRFLETQDLRNEFEAAVLKLAIYHIMAEREEDSLRVAHFKHAIGALREAAPGQISPAISLEVTSHTGS